MRSIGVATIHLLSGDSPATAAKLANELDLDSCEGWLLPHEKVERLEHMRRNGKKVLYVGDGINDGPALAASYVGVAMGAGGSPLALDTADVGILRPDVSLVSTLIQLGRVTKRRIRENLLVSAVLYNDIAIALASMGVLSPIMAAIAHNFGSVAVVLNSARLIRWGR